MDLRRDETTRIARAPAKLNLYLEITGRRSDGFHELETLIVPIRIYDTLSLAPLRAASDGQPGPIKLNVRPANAQLFEAVPPGRTNLLVRALELLQQRSGCGYGADVELVKRIPVAAGLGGGSSDAAAALRLANRAWDLDWSTDRLAEVGAEIGSDIPFFVAGGPAVCRGRGEIIEPLPSMPPLHFVVVKPPVGLHTSDVYAAHDSLGDDNVQRDSLIDRAPRLQARWQGLAGALHNRLQAAAESLAPAVQQMRALFRELGCVGHQLSGSGSAYFGVCRHAQHARRLATILRTRQLGLVYATRSCQ